MISRVFAGRSRFAVVVCAVALCALAVGVWGARGASADGQALKLVPSRTGDIKVGEKVDVEVVLDSVIPCGSSQCDGKGMAGYGFDVIFDDQSIATVEGTDVDCRFGMSSIFNLPLGLSPYRRTCMDFSLKDSGQSGKVTLTKLVFMCIRPGRATIGLDMPEIVTAGGDSTNNPSTEFLVINCVPSGSNEPLPTAVPTLTPDLTNVPVPTKVPPTPLSDGTVITPTPTPVELTPGATGSAAGATKPAGGATTAAGAAGSPGAGNGSTAVAGGAQTAQAKGTPQATVAAGTKPGGAQAQGADGGSNGAAAEDSSNGWVLWVVVVAIAAVVAVGAYAYTRFSKGKASR